MLPSLSLRIETLLFREESVIEIGLNVRPTQQPFNLQPLDVGKLAQRREAEDLQEFFRRHIGERRAGPRRSAHGA